MRSVTHGVLVILLALTMLKTLKTLVAVITTLAIAIPILFILRHRS